MSPSCQAVRQRCLVRGELANKTPAPAPPDRRGRQVSLTRIREQDVKHVAMATWDGRGGEADEQTIGSPCLALGRHCHHVVGRPRGRRTGAAWICTMWTGRTPQPRARSVACRGSCGSIPRAKPGPHPQYGDRCVSVAGRKSSTATPATRPSSTSAATTTAVPRTPRSLPVTWGTGTRGRTSSSSVRSPRGRRGDVPHGTRGGGARAGPNHRAREVLPPYRPALLPHR